MKKTTHHTLGATLLSIAILLITAVATSLVTIPAQAATCVNLTTDLAFGQTDPSYGGPVILLQGYLHEAGYLGTSPTGYFGSATQTAVKRFQAANSISQTGTAGPLTRKVVYAKTCAIIPVTIPPATTTTPPPPTNPPVTTTPPAPTITTNTDITSPTTGQLLTVGDTIRILWKNSPSGIYDISLEQPGGAGAGFVAMSQSPNITGNQYVWNVGKIFSTQTNTNQTLSPGTYRVRIENSTSGWFTIVAKQFGATSVTPTSAYADNASAVVLYGSGFNSGTNIYFDTNYSSLRANNAYVSQDGTVLVFTVPTTVASGSHTLYIDNADNTTSVTLPFTVSSIK